MIFEPTVELGSRRGREVGARLKLVVQALPQRLQQREALLDTETKQHGGFHADHPSSGRARAALLDVAGLGLDRVLLRPPPRGPGRDASP